MSDLFVLVIVGLIGIAIGFALGMGVASLRTPNAPRPRPAAPRPAQPVSKPVASVEAPQQAVVKPLPIPPASTDIPVAAPPASTDIPVAAPPAQRPTISPVNVLARAIQGEVKTPQPAPKSIAAQIDEILQEMLVESPLNSNAIRLLELPGRGMVVMVGLNQYEGVDLVPDPEIRDLIHNAVAEWERRVSG